MDSQPEFRLIYSLTVDDMIETTSLSAASTRAQAQFVKDYRRSRTILVIAVFLLVLFLVLLAPRRSMTTTIPILAVAAIFYVALWFRATARAPAVWTRAIEKNYRSGVYKFSESEQSIEVANDEIVNRFDHGESRYRLDAVREVVVGERVLLVRFDNDQEWIIPKRALQSNNDVSRFLSTLQRRPLAPPTSPAG